MEYQYVLLCYTRFTQYVHNYNESACFSPPGYSMDIAEVKLLCSYSSSSSIAQED